MVQFNSSTAKAAPPKIFLATQKTVDSHFLQLYSLRLKGGNSAMAKKAKKTTKKSKKTTKKSKK